MPYTCLQRRYIRKTVTRSSPTEPLANLFHRCSQYKAATLQLFFHQPLSIEEKELKLLPAHLLEPISISISY